MGDFILVYTFRYLLCWIIAHFGLSAWSVWSSKLQLTSDSWRLRLLLNILRSDSHPLSMNFFFCYQILFANYFIANNHLIIMLYTQSNIWIHLDECQKKIIYFLKITFKKHNFFVNITTIYFYEKSDTKSAVYWRLFLITIEKPPIIFPVRGNKKVDKYVLCSN